MSYKEDLKIIKQYAKELLDRYPERKDKVMIACEFINILDSLAKDNIISDKTYSNCYILLDGKSPYVMCGSYKVRI